MPIFNNRGPSKKRSGSGAGSGSGSGRSGGRPGGSSGGSGGGRSGGGSRFGGGRPAGKPSGKPGGKPFGKPFGKKKAVKKKRPIKKKVIKKPIFPNIENTGMEGWYFKELIESEQLVAVKLKNGDLVEGRVRYYDKDTISIGPTDGGPKLFLRKDGINYLYEVEEDRE